ncbi:predicted protein [Plenodomus lingam JN3]|uniref:Predicted protein n=1 Tax=Leptosphaeria maculans (strain JN3 / isolate v23.1.3 / race Av1-4-5-6-7-8) TaxID=985895 RepID=E5R425_LEPMJ|nr:predicted protein [Plenodomus lingam JN3]CBX91802.1 predicted protein [Plenodomus lingam JN3]
MAGMESGGRDTFTPPPLYELNLNLLPSPLLHLHQVVRALVMGPSQFGHFS